MFVKLCSSSLEREVVKDLSLCKCKVEKAKTKLPQTVIYMNDSQDALRFNHWPQFADLVIKKISLKTWLLILKFVKPC